MSLNIFKFGGASVNSAAGIRNVVDILKKNSDKPLLVVVSAMGKTTNALEEVLLHYWNNDPIALIDALRSIEQYHFDIINELFRDKNHPVFGEVDSLFNQLRGYIRRRQLYSATKPSYDFEYDQLVSFGELISSSILHNYFRLEGGNSSLFDVRELIRTDATYRDARVDWTSTNQQITQVIMPFFHSSRAGSVVITQGFIGSDATGNTTTLGREGSDFSAAIFAWCLKAKEMTIWKDVPGVMNADPKWMEDAVRLDNLSYREAVELAYYGASVIHPKTIRPLENANIKLNVRSFLKPEEPGTVVENIREWKINVPIFIRKQKQVLISISPRDFSFIIEETLSEIFKILAQFRVKVNVMQNSAISFSICVDADAQKIPPLLEYLGKDYETRYNENLELYTIRHYTDDAVQQVASKRKIIMELRSRNTIQIVLQ